MRQCFEFETDFDKVYCESKWNVTQLWTLTINRSWFLVSKLFWPSSTRRVVLKRYQIKAIKVSTFVTKKFITGETSILFATIFSRRISRLSKCFAHFRYQIEAPDSKDAYTRGCVYPMEPHANPASYANQPINQRRTSRVADSLRKWQLPIGACADYDGAG